MPAPNTFGDATRRFRLVDPREVRDHRSRFRRDALEELSLANSYYSMGGSWPDVGWLLLDRGSYAQLNPYSLNLSLELADFVNPNLTVSGITVVQARCVTTGLPTDPNSIYLVQVTNSIGALFNQWFQYPVNKQYNIRAPAYDGKYYTYSLKGGTTPWTWDQMVSDLWSQASPAGLLGTYPGLPISPAGTPEGFAFVGQPLWEAINDVLDRIGCNTAGGNGAYKIVVPGSADAAFSALQSKYARAIEDDMEYLDIGSGRAPGQVVVYFHSRYQIYGTEETVRADAPQWQGAPIYAVTVPAPAQFSSAQGTASLWDAFTVRLDINGNPIAADATTAATIAAERAQQLYATIYRGSAGSMRQVYAGLVPFSTGSLCDGVRWYNTGSREHYGAEDDYCGWRTEIIRGYVWRETTFAMTMQGLIGPDSPG